MTDIEKLSTKEIVAEITLRQKGKSGEWNFSINLLGNELRHRANVKQANDRSPEDQIFGENG